MLYPSIANESETLEAAMNSFRANLLFHHSERGRRGLINTCLFHCIAVFSAALLVCSLTAYGQEGRVLFHADTFSSVNDVFEEGWAHWCQRPEISPGFSVAEFPSIGGAGSLCVSGASNSAAHGCWYMPIPGIAAGDYYRFEASYTTRGVPHPRFQVVARLDWRRGDGDRAGQPEYAPDMEERGEWQTVGGVFLAPDGAADARIELFLGFCDQGTVWWDDVTLSHVPAPPKRMVRVGTVNCRPSDNETSAESVEEFVSAADEAGRMGCDIVCLGEGVNLVGVRGAAYPDIAEPIPGPTTERLGETARKWNMYIAAALGERDGHVVYNTAVLIDRQGKVAGKYRKVQLPREEIESGVTPGSSFPVFDTDFGRIGIMICWDNQYVEPARALAVQGAEIIFLPIWGGNAVLTRARAIENQVYVVSSGYDIGSTIYDTWGNLLAEAKERPGAAYADIDLNEPHPEPWLGNMRHRFFRELRTDIPVKGME